MTEIGSTDDIVCECNFRAKKTAINTWFALQVHRKRSHVEHRQLPNGDPLSGIVLIGK